MDTTAFLRNVSLFQGLPDQVLAQLNAIVREQTFKPETIIFREGEAGATMFIIRDGSVAVVKRGTGDNEIVLAFLGNGECFGELALIDNAPRNATIKAVDTVTVLAIAKDDFLKLLLSNQDLTLGLFKVLVSRIRETANLLNAISQEEIAGYLKQEAAQEKTDGRGLGIFSKLANIRLPQSGRRVTDVLRSLGDITDEETIRTIADLEVSDTLLGQRLVEAGEISHAQLMVAMKRSSQTGQTLSRVLVLLKLLPTDRLQEWVYRLRREKNITADDELKLLAALVRAGIITAETEKQIKTRGGKEKRKITDILIIEKIIAAEEIVRILDLPADLPFRRITTAELDLKVVNEIAHPLLSEHRAIPLNAETAGLRLLMVNPLDTKAIRALEFYSGQTILPQFITRGNYEELINYLQPQWLPASAAEGKPAPAMIADDDKTRQYIVNLCNDIIDRALNANASDIHIEPQADRNRIRYRIDGILHDIVSYPEDIHLALVSALKLRAEMDIANRLIPQDGKLKHEFDGKEVIIRAASLPASRGEKLVLRIHKEADVTFGLRELGFTDRQFIEMESLINTPYGMLLVVGPVGSGKTTTLYSVLNTMDVLENNIVTIEDPIEYELQGINHVQVNYKTGLDYVTGLKAILRQDPDVIMLGEIRDVDSARIATRAACTGVILLSTMHANDAPSTVSVLLHLGIEPIFVVNSLIGIVAQRLLRKICKHCKQSYHPGLDVLQTLGLPEGKEYTFFRGRGCPECFHTGYKGRTGIFEIMRVGEKLREMILSRANESEIRRQAVTSGMSTLRQNALLKVMDGTTTVEELFNVTIRDDIEFSK